jgi:hypothetical protein
MGPLHIRWDLWERTSCGACLLPFGEYFFSVWINILLNHKQFRIWKPHGVSWAKSFGVRFHILWYPGTLVQGYFLGSVGVDILFFFFFFFPTREEQQASLVCCFFRLRSPMLSILTRRIALHLHDTRLWIALQLRAFSVIGVVGLQLACAWCNLFLTPSFHWHGLSSSLAYFYFPVRCRIYQPTKLLSTPIQSAFPFIQRSALSSIYLFIRPDVMYICNT